MSADVAACVGQCLLGRGERPCAVISDIHSNLRALEAVLADIESQGVQNVCCLGDVVGYGVRPVECWRIVSARCPVIILGNHDQALSMKGVARFHPRARRAVEWAKARILEEEDGGEMLARLIGLPVSFACENRLFVHGSPAGPTMDYLLPGDAFDLERMNREFGQVELAAFNGHSHIPGVIERGGAFIPPEGLPDATYGIGEAQAIINVGSVGQPRDGNPRSCYVILDGDRVRYRRVPYDAHSAAKEILAQPELDPFLGYRLIEGR
ncbi:MAG: metallophosphatase family protein [Planctomycetota bacterium]|nr:metallophosphatase family protein [Planctomycetota bacterium]